MIDALLDRPPIEVLPREQRPDPRTDEITEWCPTCLERVVAMRNGSCGWCDTPLLDAEGEPLTVQPAGTSVLVPAPPEPNGTAQELDRAVVSEFANTETPAPERVPRRRDRRHRHGKAYTDEQIIARIQLWARLTGGPPAKADWTVAKLRSRATAARESIEAKLRLIALYELGDFPSETTVRDRFGSLNAALVLAGFEPRGTGRPPRPENEACARTVAKPKVGRSHLARYHKRTVELRDEWGDGPALKAALYELALSAIAEADRIPGVSEDLM